MRRVAVLFLALLSASCASSNQPSEIGATTVAQAASPAPTARLDLVDPARNRAIPVVLYYPARSRGNAHLKLAIFSHGYGGQHTGYSFLASNLAAHGYLVASIQHELPTDEPLPMTGNILQVRRPNWERGVQNIRFVVREVRKQHPQVNIERLLLAGHSNGGDMAMLYAQKYPREVERIISLDNRRMAFPRASRPRVLSLRSSDQVADSGVLPTPAEQQQFGVAIISLPGTIHNDMWDGATEVQKREMNNHISHFLEN